MSDIFGNASSANLNDVVITDSITNGSFTITTLNNERYPNIFYGIICYE